MATNSLTTPRSGFALPALMALATLCVGGIAMFPIAEGWDKAVFTALALREGQSPPALVTLAKASTALGDGDTRAWILGAAALWLCFKRRWKTGIVVIVVPTLVGMISNGLKIAFDSPRPDIVPHIVHAGGMSMPSGHAVAGIGIALALVWLLPAQPKRGWVAFAVLVGLFVGVSRIMLGVHWPTDVIAGWLLGVAGALVAREIASRLEA